MNLIQLLNKHGSRLYKEQILRSASQLDCKTLEYAYDQTKTYGLKFSDYDIDLTRLGEPQSGMFNLLDMLANRQYSGLEARNNVEAWAETFGDLIKLICNRDLQCGITATTINKVFPGLIPQFKLQLAKEVPLNSLIYPLLAQLKYDGVRIAITWDGSKTLFRTRNGKIIYLPKYAKYIEKQNLEPFMLDTEITLLGGKTTDRTKVSGMINSARHGNSIDEDSLVFNIFDAMSLKDFNSCNNNEPYILRLELAEKITKALRSISFRLAETYRVDSAKEANDLFKDFLSQEQEGIILKNKNHKYTFKRSKDWVKVKAIKTCDLKCIDILDGTGKYFGLIGALVCEGEVEGKQVKVNIGSGLTDYDRNIHINTFIDKIIEIKYNSIIQDSITKEWSLFLPRFVTIRHDK